jgi:site-specific recombinase XerD
MKAHTPSVPQVQAQTRSHSQPSADPPLSYTHRPDVGRRGPDPLEYDHRYASLRDHTQLLVLRYDHGRTRHAYYRQLRLLSDHFHCDPATLSESQVRDYFLHVKTMKHWKPKTIRQAAACARLFFLEQLGHQDWTVFSQIRAHDQARYPAVMTRDQVVGLLQHIRLRRYRIPIKLIYCCGLRLSECLNLTIHDIRGAEGKLWVRSGKGGRDRMVPICPANRWASESADDILVSLSACQSPIPRRLLLRKLASPLPFPSRMELLPMTAVPAGFRIPASPHWQARPPDRGRRRSGRLPAIGGCDGDGLPAPFVGASCRPQGTPRSTATFPEGAG